MGPEFYLLSGMTVTGIALGVAEAVSHRRVLTSLPLRIHVNGTRGKTSVTKAIAELFRALGQRTVAKSTGSAAVFIDPEGNESPWHRQGRPRIHEQLGFLRKAAKLGAEAVVVECMAVEPVFQWVAEHQIVRSHIGVITNARMDHLEQMGNTNEQIARSLANTIPRKGVLVTADMRFYPLFVQLAQPLGTRVVLARPDDWPDVFENGKSSWVDGQFADNVAIACTVAREAGFGQGAITQAVATLEGSESAAPVVPLRYPVGPMGERSVFAHCWAINDPDSYVAFATSDMMPSGVQVPLFNHRLDRPLRTVQFARLFSSVQPPLARLLVTGDEGAERIFANEGIPRERIRRVPFPPSAETVAEAVGDLEGRIVVVGCGNAQGVVELEAAARQAVASARMGDYE